MKSCFPRNARRVSRRVIQSGVLKGAADAACRYFGFDSPPWIVRLRGQ
jgi:hypothetical protein